MQAYAWRREKGLAYTIGVDGGVDFKTAAECAHVGADSFISGTALFSRPNMRAAVKKLRKIVEVAGLKISEPRSLTGRSRELAFSPRPA